jgi:hypothetical protein
MNLGESYYIQEDSMIPEVKVNKQWRQNAHYFKHTKLLSKKSTKTLLLNFKDLTSYRSVLQLQRKSSESEKIKRNFVFTGVKK